MSFEGKLARGLKWYQFRDRDGNYPEGITDSEKSLDLEFFLEFSEGKDIDKITEILKKTSVMARTSKKRLKVYKDLVAELKSEKLLKKEKPKQETKGGK